jgi:hypothetical protein
MGFAKDKEEGKDVLVSVSFFTPDNIAIISGLGSLCLSLSGILLNLYKIKKQNEKIN